MNIIDPPGNQTLMGTTGHDTFIFYDNWGQDTISAPAGNNILDFSHTTADISVTNTINSIGTVATDNANPQDVVRWSTTNQFQKAIAGSGNDGLSGFNIAIGGSGNDTLQGTAGNDLLEAGTGNDVLAGGFEAPFKNDGNDTYIFNH